MADKQRVSVYIDGRTLSVNLSYKLKNCSVSASENVRPIKFPNVDKAITVRNVQSRNINIYSWVEHECSISVPGLADNQKRTDLTRALYYNQANLYERDLLSLSLYIDTTDSSSVNCSNLACMRSISWPEFCSYCQSETFMTGTCSIVTNTINRLI